MRAMTASNLADTSDGTIVLVPECHCFGCERGALGLDRKDPKGDLGKLGWRVVGGRWHCEHCAAEARASAESPIESPGDAKRVAEVDSRTRLAASRAPSLETYLSLHDQLIQAGYGHEVEWAENVQPVADAISFWSEYAWVVLNSGMKNQVAQGIWQKVRPAVLRGESATTVFGHAGKAAGIDRVYADRDALFEAYLAAEDKIHFIRALPWIGPITCWHLAKNYGFDCAKPDRHLVRIAGTEGVDATCRRLAAAAKHRVATVDLVLWRAANLGLI